MPINLKLVEERTGKKISSIEELQSLLDEKDQVEQNPQNGILDVFY